jgi:NADH:ubiquinone oxidoreductase subunit F (NADH-binding)
MRLFDTPERFGPLPATGKSFLDVFDRSALAGRGGASFSTATKWRAVAQRSRGDAVIVVNGAECEPQSKKDRVLMTTRPHLVLDGALVAARVLRARHIVLYIGERHEAARESMVRALAEREEPESRLVGLAAAPARYVAGGEAAAVHFINDGVATPTTVPPYPFERGVGGAPTLVQNVETLAHIAVLARTGSLPGTLLITLAGAIARPGVVEVEVGTAIGDVVSLAGGPSAVPRAVLVGGYFGRWMSRSDAWQVPLTPAAGVGCGVIGLLPEARCPVCDTAGIMRYLAAESAAQCGPCFFGLRALADATTRIAESGADAANLARLNRWAVEVRGRGACKHPDGAAIFVSSALEVFAREFAEHKAHHRARVRA